MKGFIIYMSLFSINAFSCPTLSGTFNCKLGSSIFDVKIENTETGYDVTTSSVLKSYHTDGKIYSIPETDSYKDAKIISSCDGEKFVIDFTASILYEGSVIAHEVQKSEYFMEGEDLIINRKTKMKGIPMPTNRYVCTRY